MYHTRSFLNSLSEAYSGRVHNFTSQQSYISEEKQESSVWGETRDGKPYQRWSPGYVDSEKKQKPVPYNYQRSQLVSAIFGYKPNQKKSKTESDMLYRVESAMVLKGEALIESFTPDHAAEILTNYLFNQGLNPDPVLVGEFVDLLESSDSVARKYAAMSPESWRSYTQEMHPDLKAKAERLRQKGMALTKRPAESGQSSDSNPQKNNSAFVNTPRKKQEAGLSSTATPEQIDASGSAGEPETKGYGDLKKKRERMLRRGRELDAKTIRSVASGFNKQFRKAFKDISKSKAPEAAGGDIGTGRGTSYHGKR